MGLSVKLPTVLSIMAAENEYDNTTVKQVNLSHLIIENAMQSVVGPNCRTVVSPIKAKVIHPALQLLDRSCLVP